MSMGWGGERNWLKGSKAEWEGSAAGCCPGHTTCLPDVPCPAVAPGAGSRKLDTSASAAGMLWERFIQACVWGPKNTGCWLLASAACRPLLELPSSHLTPQCLTSLVPFSQARPHPVQKACTHGHEHTHGFNHTGCMPPFLCKKVWWKFKMMALIHTLCLLAQW